MKKSIFDIEKANKNSSVYINYKIDVRGTMENKYKIINIPDEEIILKEDELLNSLTYVNELINKIKEIKIFSIVGLYGMWGSGKSSIIKTVENKLANDKNYVFINYDAWKYTGNSFRKDFLLKIAEKIDLINKTDKEKKSLKEKYYNTKAKNNSKDKIKYGAFSLITGLCMLIILTQSDNPNFKIGIPYSVIGIFIVLEWILKFLKYSSETESIQITTHPLSSSEEFEEVFNNLCNKFDYNKKIIITIDNLDRCSSSDAYELLTIIKSFFNKRNNLIFLLPVDDSAIKRHFKKIFDYNDEEATEFLSKVINSQIYIKPLQQKNIHNFISNLCSKENVGINKQTQVTISEFGFNNPRKIIHFINNLSNELSLFTTNKKDIDFVNKNEHIIAVILYIKENFTIFYQQLKMSSYENIFDFPEEKIKGDKNYNYYKTMYENLKKYLKESSLEDIQYILYHTKQNFIFFDDEDSEYLHTLDTDKFLNKYEKEDLIAYLITACKVIDTNALEFLLYFELLIKILLKEDKLYMTAEVIEIYKKINPDLVNYSIENNTTLDLIKDKISLIGYALKCEKSGRDIFIAHIMGYIEISKINKEIAYTFFKHVNDEKKLKSIGSNFINNLVNEKIGIKEIDIPPTNLKKMFTNNAFYDYTNNFIENNVNYSDYLYVLDSCNPYDMKFMDYEYNHEFNLIEYFYLNLATEKPIGDLLLFNLFLKKINDIINHININKKEIYEYHHMDTILDNILDRIIDSLQNENKKEIYSNDEKDEIFRFYEIFKQVSSNNDNCIKMEMIGNLLKNSEENN